ncbi:MAG: hypothetical protein HKO59_17270 [Phycisphaerales bacterium]|nr:hypothetical protein [Phycisphaerae bacterium]NNM27701.1 hypothetical protein [Phycisphaerales bacterium]
MRATRSSFSLLSLASVLLAAAAAHARPVVVNMPLPPVAATPPATRLATGPAGNDSATPAAAAESLALRRYARARSAPRPDGNWGWRGSAPYGWYRGRGVWSGGFRWFGSSYFGYGPFFFGHHHYFPFVHVHHRHHGFRPASH